MFKKLILTLIAASSSKSSSNGNGACNRQQMLGRELINITAANAGELPLPDINPTRDSNPISKKDIRQVCLKQHQIDYEFNNTTSAPTDLLSQ